MPDAICGRGRLMLSRWFSKMNLSGLELRQVGTTKLISLRTFWIVLNVAGRGLEGISLRHHITS